MTVGLEKTVARHSAHGGIGLNISLAGANRLIVTAVDTVLDWQDRARQRHQMARMDDHLLRDIGLSRADLEHELTKPFWRT